MRFSVITLADLFFFALLPGFFSVAMVIASFTSGNPVEGLVIGWVAIALWAGIGFHLLWSRAHQSPKLQYSTRHGLTVAWTQPSYAVSREAVERITEATLLKMERRFPDAGKALQGCLLLFREPVWTQLTTCRRVAGEQDYSLLTVGWADPLEKSALAHELAHRVLQVYAGDPSEQEAHHVLYELGL